MVCGYGFPQQHQFIVTNFSIQMTRDYIVENVDFYVLLMVPYLTFVFTDLESVDPQD